MAVAPLTTAATWICRSAGDMCDDMTTAAAAADLAAAAVGYLAAAAAADLAAAAAADLVAAAGCM